MLSTTIQVFFEWVSAIEDAFTGLERFSEYIHHDFEPGETLPAHAIYHTKHPRSACFSGRSSFSVGSQKSVGPFEGLENAEVRVEGLSLRYSASGPLVLDDISFCVPKGQRIGIIGQTGSGKSSLIQALFHMYPFVAGRIFLDGYEAKLENKISVSYADFISLEDFRKGISLISQEPTLFMGSLLDNLSLDATVSADRIFQLIQEFGLDYLIPDKEAMEKFFIEEKGKNLSAGERQVLCMIRCVLYPAPLILMDEATSSVDEDSEKAIVRALHSYFKNKTQIIVAHRLSTIASCDRIIWLDKGKIVMDGAPDEVLKAFLG
jgi:ABC-type multidrug transport system fused ATPase/permease subunit